MNKKILIFSFSKMAIQIAKILSKKKYKIVIIEQNKKLIKQAKSYGYEVEDINAMNDANFIKIGIKDDNIKAFFCVSDDKNINLFVTLSVRNLNKNIKIISVSSSVMDNKTMLLAGANKIINPYEIGALRIFRLLHKPYILNILDSILFSNSDINVEEITIKKGTILDGAFVKNLNIIDKENIIILGIQDKELSDKFTFFSTGINHKIDADDTLVVLGKSNDLEKFRNEINSIA
jgi:voltage-gated potassium channel